MITWNTAIYVVASRNKCDHRIHIIYAKEMSMQRQKTHFLTWLLHFFPLFKKRHDTKAKESDLFKPTYK